MSMLTGCQCNSQWTCLQTRAAAQALQGSEEAAEETTQNGSTATVPEAKPDFAPRAETVNRAELSGAARADDGTGVARTAAALQRPKWKYMARKQLQANAGRMKLSRLKKRLLSATESQPGSNAEHSMMQTLSKSSQFDVQQTHILLRS